MPVPTTAGSLAELQSFLTKFGDEQIGISNSVPNTVLVPKAPQGVYRISVYMTTATPGSAAVTMAVTFTDRRGTKTVSFTGIVLNASEFQPGGVDFSVESGDISYSTTYGPGTGSYDLAVIVEKVR